MGAISLPKTWIAEILTANDLNASFVEIRDKFNNFAVLTDTIKTIAVSHTWSAAQSFPGLTSTAGLTVSSGTSALQAVTGTTLVLSSSATVASVVSSGAISGTAGTFTGLLTGAGVAVTGGAASLGRITADATHGIVITGTAGATNDVHIRDHNGVGRVILTGVSTVSIVADILAVTGALTVSGTINGQTIAASSSFSGTLTAGTGLTVSSGGITVTGNSTITGTLGGVTTLTCTTVTATNLGGTLSTAAQANVTSLGTLTVLTVSGVSIDRLTGGGAKIAEATSGGNFWIGPQSAILTTATQGYLIIPNCNGTPTGIPSGLSGTNGTALVWDYNAKKLWAHNGGTWYQGPVMT